MRSFWIYTALTISLLTSACQECGECPAPPEGFRFQVVDVLGRDLVRSSRARYKVADISMHFNDAGRQYPVVLSVDTFQNGKAIFKAPFAANLVQMGYTDLVLDIANLGSTDTIRPHVSKIDTYCCKYILYNFALQNEDTLARSPDDDFVFWVKKK